MRKLFLIMIVAILALTGCVKEEVAANDDEIKVVIDISEVKDDIYRLDLSYFLDGELMGGQAVSHTDTSRLKGTYAFTLINNDFPENADLSGFSFQITVSGDKEGINDLFSSADLMKTTDPSESFAVSYGNIYRYKLSGSFKEGFSLKKQ